MARINIFTLHKKASLENMDLTKDEGLISQDDQITTPADADDLVKTKVDAETPQTCNTGSVKAVDASDVNTGTPEVATLVPGEEPLEATESNLHVSAEEHSVEVMDAEVDYIEVCGSGLTPAFDEVSESVDELLEDQETVERVTVALEAYLDILDDLKAQKRDISPQLAQAMRIGLESFDSEFFKETVFSVEDAVVPYGDGPKKKAREVTAEKMTGKLTEALKTGYNILMRIVRAVMDLYQRMTLDVDKLAESLKEIKRDATKLVGGTDMQVKGLGRLSINGEFVGDNYKLLEKVRDLATTVLITWPNNLASSVTMVGDKTKVPMFNINNVRNVIEDGAWGEVQQSIVKNIETTFKNALNKAKASDKDKVPSGFLSSGEVLYSDTLPGGRALYLGIGSISGKDAVGSDIKLKSNFSAVPGNDNVGGEETITTMTSMEAVRVVSTLEQIVKVLDTAVSGNDKLKETIKDFERVNEGLINGMILGGGNRGQQVNNLYMYRISMQLLSMLKNSQYLFTGYLISLIKAEIAVLKTMLKIEEGDSVTVEG